MNCLKPFGFYNAYAIVAGPNMDAENISELEKFTNTLRAGFHHEFFERRDGYPRFVKQYGIEFENKSLAWSISWLIRQSRPARLM